MNNEPTGIEAEVCKDIANRQALGLVKYGVSVADNPLAFEEWLQHSYTERLDDVIYTKRAIVECALLREQLSAAKREIEELKQELSKWETEIY